MYLATVLALWIFSHFPEPNLQAEASMAQKDKFCPSWSMTETAEASSSPVNQQEVYLSDLLKCFQVSSSFH